MVHPGWRWVRSPSATVLAALALALWMSMSAVVGAGVATAAPAGVPSRIDGMRIDRLGSGDETVVLIPGLLSGPWAFGDAAEILAREYTVYQVTLPGFDGVEAEPAKDRIGDATRAVGDLVEAIGSRRPVLIGHSLGGTVALRVAAKHPVAGVIAVDGLPVLPGVADLPPDQRAAAADRAAAPLDAVRTPEEKWMYSVNYLSTSGTLTPGVADKYAPRMALGDVQAAADYTRELVALDDRPVLPKIGAPVLEIVPYDPGSAPRGPDGATMSQDRVLDRYRSLLAGVRDLRVEVAAPSKHFVMLDQPQRFLALTEAFLAAHAR